VSRKPVLLRERAERDVEAAVDYYAHEADPDIAFHFIEALRSAYRTIAEHPAVGSHRYALDLALPGLRNWAVKGFPHLVFYIERDDHIDVWRVLHGRRDIPSRMREPEA
jgi:toxin ParE1/3/4